MSRGRDCHLGFKFKKVFCSSRITNNFYRYLEDMSLSEAEGIQRVFLPLLARRQLLSSSNDSRLSARYVAQRFLASGVPSAILDIKKLYISNPLGFTNMKSINPGTLSIIRYYKKVQLRGV